MSPPPPRRRLGQEPPTALWASPPSSLFDLGTRRASLIDRPCQSARTQAWVLTASTSSPCWEEATSAKLFWPGKPSSQLVPHLTNLFWPGTRTLASTLLSRLWKRVTSLQEMKWSPCWPRRGSSKWQTRWDTPSSSISSPASKQRLRSFIFFLF